MPLSFLFSPLRRLYCRSLQIFYHGNRVLCPVCNTSFRRFKNVSRQRATPLGNTCPRCGSFERHRLLWLFLLDRTDLFSSTGNRTLLHIAPERCLKKKFEGMDCLTYTTADLRSTDAKLKIDITAIPLPDNSVDAIICSHVLEHVPDDRKAMKELFRVLTSGGWAVLNVPVDYTREQTYEDRSITTAALRKIHFGQADHVRVYGKDYRHRLSASGFNVREIDYCGELGLEKARRHVLLADEMIYFCTKQHTEQ